MAESDGSLQPAGPYYKRRVSQANHPITFALVCALFTGVACSKHGKLAAPAAPLTPPTRLCSTNEAPPACRDVRGLEQLLDAEGSILGMSDTPSGAQGAKVLTLRAKLTGRETVLRTKWRPQSSGDLINEPRKELASYAVQKLFLSESEFVIPPTVAHCFPLAEYRKFAPDEPSSFEAADCVLGFESYWLENVRTVEKARETGLMAPGDGIWDAKLFDRDALYRNSVSSANVLTFVIRHGDAHNGQFLLESTRHGLRAFVVDNSVAFLSVPNPMLLFREDWGEIQVPRLPARAIERLRKLSDADFARLGTVTEFELRGRQLYPARTPSEPAIRDDRAMSWHGSRLRIGLTANEIALVRSRVRTLLERPDLPQLLAP